MIEVRRNSPKVGDQAPGFTLKDSDMKHVSLGDYRGKKVVLAFFPAAFSGTCTTELCTFQKSMHDFNDMDAHILGISVDLPYTLREFRQSEHIGFPLLSDFDRTAINTYAVVDGDFHGYHSGVAQRSVFVIDPAGTLTWSWIAEKQTQQPDYGEVYEAIQ